MSRITKYVTKICQNGKSDWIKVFNFGKHLYRSSIMLKIAKNDNIWMSLIAEFMVPIDIERC